MGCLKFCSHNSTSTILNIHLIGMIIFWAQLSRGKNYLVRREQT